MTRRLLLWEIQAEGRSTAARPLPAGFVSIGPAFEHDAMPPEIGILLPRTDTNSAVLSALEADPKRFHGLGVGLFLADPFLNVDLAIRSLWLAGIGWVAAVPSACQHEPEFRQYLREVDLDLDRELRVLAAFSGAGLRTIATASSATDAAAAGRVAAALLALPHVGFFVDGHPRLAARRQLERSVKDQATICLGLRQRNEAKEAGQIDGHVLSPLPF